MVLELETSAQVQAAAAAAAEKENERELLVVVEAFALGFETPVVAFSVTMVDSAFYSNRILLVTHGFDCGGHDDDGGVD